MASEPVSGETLEAVINALRVWLDHLGTVAENAATAAVAARNLLVSKGLVTEEEWDSAVDEVRRQHATLLGMDPEAQVAIDELRRLLGGEGREGGQVGPTR